MIIKPMIQGVIARSAHPHGCKEAIRRQISYCRTANPISQGPKRALILGASSGFGLATRIALAFGGAQTETLGVSFERGPSEKGTGSAGWYNNIYFRQAAEQAGIKAVNLVGDAFSPAIRQQVIDTLRAQFDGQVDLIVYSLASGVRPDPATGEFWRSSIKPIGKPYQGTTLDLERQILTETILPPATEQEIHNTVKVMGGEDWASWIETLIQADVLAPGCKTMAYSYIGSSHTNPIYHHGTLGRAKAHLHQTADQLHQQLATVGGEAYVAVCKALITKASVFIPGLSPYLLALFQVMKAKGLHEGCIEQMQRLLSHRLYPDSGPVITDHQRLIRVDDWELSEDVQQEVSRLLTQMTAKNFRELGDMDGYLNDFLNLNGFGFDNIDYTRPISPEELVRLKP
ncbi:enoyl-ACP reductase FabV [Photobacterium atrarenae]|uniref:Enoyl-[acyl-carrier-protein] reductase [NADH] n=1 Tax=Photobacterium atrarenae TaxID=865757 RepID=A0ABY5GN84_9GAMM|nr:enoyl-ACP reductase FabV [Photobacterium atrarenae]UTV30787.1 trans-2-enoyl-CoA reductase family protein [Photobacterium atrarenae]